LIVAVVLYVIVAISMTSMAVLFTISYISASNYDGLAAAGGAGAFFILFISVFVNFFNIILMIVAAILLPNLKYHRLTSASPPSPQTHKNSTTLRLLGWSSIVLPSAIFIAIIIVQYIFLLINTNSYVFILLIPMIVMPSAIALAVGGIIALAKK